MTELSDKETDCRISIRLECGDKAKLQEEADKLNIKLSEYIRRKLTT